MDDDWVDPGTSKRNAAKRWTAEEDAILRELIMDSGEDAISWVDVSRHLAGRSNKDSRRRWTKIKNNFNRGNWSREEDENLRVAVARFGQQWALVTEVVETRSPDQCQKRWRNALDPKISSSVSWSSEEDQRLRAAVAEMGKNWSQISDRYFPNRSPLSLSNRYTSFEQHSKNSTASASQKQRRNLSAPEKRQKSNPPQNVSSMNSTTRSPEPYNAVIPTSLSDQADIIDQSNFNEALEGSNSRFSWDDVPCDFSYDGMLLSDLEPSSSIDTALSRQCIPYLVNSSSPNDHSVSTDVQMTNPPSLALQHQEVQHASSCSLSQQSPSGTANSVLILENLDDETRDAVLRVIWSKRSRTTLRME